MVLRGIPEMDAAAIANRLLLEECRKLPYGMRWDIVLYGRVIIDFHSDPYWKIEFIVYR